MRIVLVGPYAPYRGGIAHFAASIHRGLAARGHEVEPLTFSRQYPRLFFPGRTELEENASRSDAQAPRVLDSLNPISWIRAGRTIRRRRADAVLYSFWHPFFAPAYGSIARTVGRSAKQVAIVHNALPHERRAGDAVLARFFLSACDGLLTMSESVASDVRSLAPSVPVRRVPHPVYDVFGDPPSRRDAREALGLPPSGPVALFFGFVRAYKGLSTLLQAVPEIVRRVPDFRLVVAGEFYDDKRPYPDLLRSAGVESRVHVHDAYIPSDEVGRYFAAADVVVQPYTSATQSGVAQIAYHFDRPLVVTDVGGLAEVVPDGRAGFVVPPSNPGALADAVVRFFNDSFGEKLAPGVREEKKRYSWPPLIDALESLIAGKA